MDDEAVGINNRKLVIRVITCMIMIRLYVPGFSRWCRNCCWCIRDQMAAVHEEYNGVWAGNIHFLPNFRFFCSNFTLFLNFYSFSNVQKVRKPWLKTFSSIIMCKSRFFPKQKKKTKKQKKQNWFWALKRVSVAIVTYFIFEILHTL